MMSRFMKLLRYDITCKPTKDIFAVKARKLRSKGFKSTGVSRFGGMIVVRWDLQVFDKVEFNE